MTAQSFSRATARAARRLLTPQGVTLSFLHSQPGNLRNSENAKQFCKLY